jgi:hypothetical protein
VIWEENVRSNIQKEESREGRNGRTFHRIKTSEDDSIFLDTLEK